MSNTSIASPVAPAVDPVRRRRAVAAGIVGNALEWYDFAVYAFVVPVISAIFFPTSDPATATLLSLAILGSGFVMRPVGAVIFGALGDRVGRRASLSIVMLIMGGATAAIGLLPTYAAIGVAAPILLVAARLLQGLATGGELGGAASFVVEYAPANRRGLFGGLHFLGVGGGLVLGSLAVMGVSALVGPEALVEWGWRVPFLIGGLVAIVGLFIRLRISDTPAFEAAVEAGARVAAPLRQVFRSHWRDMLRAFAIAVFPSITSWLVLTWIVTFFVASVGLPLTLALQINLVGLVIFTVATPLFGRLSDRTGRKPMLIAGTVLTAVAVVPAFLGIVTGDVPLVLLCSAGIVLAYSVNAGALTATLVEIFPTPIRVTGLSIGYNLAQTIFGGFAPFIASFLIVQLGTPIAPTGYVIAGAVVSLLALIGFKETAFSPLR